MASEGRPGARRRGVGSKAASRKIGLRDVAAVAGVSTATVSRAINSPGLVSPELRERVASVVKHLGWIPDAAARALTTRRSFTIGAVFPTMTQGDFARAIQALQSELHARGYTLLLACSEYDPDQELQQVAKFVERGVDGIILVGEAHHPDLAPLLERHGVPHLFTFVYSAERHGSSVGPDNRKALATLTEYLADLGHRRFGVIAQSARNNDRAGARVQGIRGALASRGIAVRPGHFAEGQWTIGEGRALFSRIMAETPAPTAIICGNAYLAVGALLEALAQGFSVPEDVTIVGYDDIEIMRELPVPITTVRVLADEVGRRAARHLLARIEGAEEEQSIYECAAEIVVRSSSGPPPDDV
jgi:LacI family transcriptional regulator